MLRPATRVDVRQVMEQERAEFVRLLRSLTDDDRDKPTVCEEWTVGDLAVHLLGDDLSFLSRNRDARRNEDLDSTTGGAGSAGPREQPWDAFVEALDAHNNRWVEAGRFLSARLVAELLEFTGPKVAEFLESADSSTPGEVVSWAGPDPAPWWLVDARSPARIQRGGGARGHHGRDRRHGPRRVQLGGSSGRGRLEALRGTHPGGCDEVDTRPGHRLALLDGPDGCRRDEAQGHRRRRRGTRGAVLRCRVRDRPAKVNPQASCLPTKSAPTESVMRTSM